MVVVVSSRLEDSEQCGNGKPGPGLLRGPGAPASKCVSHRVTRTMDDAGGRGVSSSTAPPHQTDDDLVGVITQRSGVMGDNNQLLRPLCLASYQCPAAACSGGLAATLLGLAATGTSRQARPALASPLEQPSVQHPWMDRSSSWREWQRGVGSARGDESIGVPVGRRHRRRGWNGALHCWCSVRRARLPRFPALGDVGLAGLFAHH